MAQAQKVMGVGGMERFVTTVGNLAPVFPSVLDAVNVDRWANRYGDMLGLDPDIINSPDEIAAIRDGRAQAQAQQMQAEQAKLEADALAKLGSVPANEPSLLNEMMARGSAGVPTPTLLPA